MTIVWNNTCTIFRSEYKTRKAYLIAYRECVANYGFKVRVTGGWKFFSFVTDYATYKKQH
jgi:hypothetical protein